MQQHELLLTILEETDRLNRLVGNILDLAKVRAGALIPQTVADRRSTRSPRRWSARLRRRADEQGVAMELKLRPNVPEIAADPVQLDQVLTNLLENALRHSPAEGIVRVHLGVIPRGVRIRVSDRGSRHLPR